MGRGMRVTNVTDRVLLLGGNLFESGKINVPANDTVPAGTVLTRDTNDKKLFLPAGATDDFVAIVPFDLENVNATPKITGFRACISGQVRGDMIIIDGTPATVDQCDLLRDKTGIIAKQVTDISHLDNQ